MSVVSVKVYENKIVFAADSIVTKGWSKTTDSDFVKLARINDVIVGGCGYAEEMSLMWHYLRTHKPDGNDEKAILDFIIEFASWKKNLTGNSAVNNTYLIGFDGKCHYVNKLFVHKVTNYKAIGAGEDFANAALHLNHSAEESVRVACDLSCFVAEPILKEEMEIK